MIRNLESRHLNRFYSKKFKFFNISHSNRDEKFLFLLILIKPYGLKLMIRRIHLWRLNQKFLTLLTYKLDVFKFIRIY